MSHPEHGLPSPPLGEITIVACLKGLFIKPGTGLYSYLLSPEALVLVEKYKRVGKRLIKLFLL